MKVINGIELFSLSDILGDALCASSLSEIKRVARLWCENSGAFYGVGSPGEVVSAAQNVGLTRALIAESQAL
jgi:hypothetical protein